MAEYTFRIDVDGLADPRLEWLDDLYEKLIDHGGLLGPSLSGDLVTGRMSLRVTVEQGSAKAASAFATTAFRQALIETGSSQSIATVSPAELVA
jgi:hypothetical protein